MLRHELQSSRSRRIDQRNVSPTVQAPAKRGKLPVGLVLRSAKFHACCAYLCSPTFSFSNIKTIFSAADQRLTLVQLRAALKAVPLLVPPSSGYDGSHTRPFRPHDKLRCPRPSYFAASRDFILVFHLIRPPKSRTLALSNLWDDDFSPANLSPAK